MEGAKNVASPESTFVSIEMPKQKHFGDEPFPLVFSPAQPAGGLHLADAIRTHKPWLEARLQKVGAILFRGYGVKTASDFSDVFEAFEYEDAPVVVSGANRAHVVGRIFTANDGPPHMTFYSHNEMGYIKNHPSKGFFYCEVEPESGGETPIVLGHALYQRMVEKYPDFVERIEQNGLVYSRSMPDGSDPNSLIGRGWQSTFGTDDKVVAEKKAAELGWTLEWLEDGAVKASMGQVPGVKLDSHPAGERKVFFNSLAAAYLTWTDSRNEQGAGVQFGDGTPLPDEIMQDYLKIIDQECVAFTWKQGDVLMVDNHTVQHGRTPFTGTRRVLVVFTK